MADIPPSPVDFRQKIHYTVKVIRPHAQWHKIFREPQAGRAKQGAADCSASKKINISGCSAVGSALALGARCRVFESPHSDHLLQENRLLGRFCCVKTFFLTDGSHNALSFSPERPSWRFATRRLHSQDKAHSSSALFRIFINAPFPVGTKGSCSAGAAHRFLGLPSGGWSSVSKNAPPFGRASSLYGNAASAYNTYRA